MWKKSFFVVLLSIIIYYKIKVARTPKSIEVADDEYDFVISETLITLYKVKILNFCFLF